MARDYDGLAVIGRETVDAMIRRRRIAATADALPALICGVVAAVCEVQECLPDDSLLDLGGHSLRAAEVAGVVKDAVGLVVPLDVVLEAQTPQRISEPVPAAATTQPRIGAD